MTGPTRNHSFDFQRCRNISAANICTYSTLKTFVCFSFPCFEVIRISPLTISIKGRSHCWQIRIDLPCSICKISLCDFGLWTAKRPSHLIRYRSGHHGLKKFCLLLCFPNVKSFRTFDIKSERDGRIYDPRVIRWRLTAQPRGRRQTQNFRLLQQESSRRLQPSFHHPLTSQACQARHS